MPRWAPAGAVVAGTLDGVPEPSRAVAGCLPRRTVTEILDRIGAGVAGGAEGSLWLAFLDRRGRLAHCAPIEEGTGHVDELFLRDLTDLVRGIDAPALVLAVRRRSGHSARVDRLLRRELIQRLAGGSPTRVDLLVLGAA